MKSLLLFYTRLIQETHVHAYVSPAGKVREKAWKTDRNKIDQQTEVIPYVFTVSDTKMNNPTFLYGLYSTCCIAYSDIYFFNQKLLS